MIRDFFLVFTMFLFLSCCALIYYDSTACGIRVELRKPTAPKASQRALFDMSPCVFANAKIEKRCSFAKATKAENCVFCFARMERFRETANPSVGRKLFFCVRNIRHFLTTIAPPLFRPDRAKRKTAGISTQ